MWVQREEIATLVYRKSRSGAHWKLCLTWCPRTNREKWIDAKCMNSCLTPHASSLRHTKTSPSTEGSHWGRHLTKTTASSVQPNKMQSSLQTSFSLEKTYPNVQMKHWKRNAWLTNLLVLMWQKTGTAGVTVIRNGSICSTRARGADSHSTRTNGNMHTKIGTMEAREMQTDRRERLPPNTRNCHLSGTPALHYWYLKGWISQTGNFFIY